MPSRHHPRRSSWIVAPIVFVAAFAGFFAFAGIPGPASGLTADSGAGGVRGERSTPRPTTGAAVRVPATQALEPDQTPLPPALPDPFAGEVAVPSAPPVAELTGYQWPLRGRLTLGFRHTPWGTRLVDGERFHDGIDIATFCGDRIRAAHSGVVLAAGRRFDDHVGWVGDLRPYYERLDRRKAWGSLPIVVVIDDENGYRSIYAHFSKVTVKKGQRVEAGDVIGVEGATGRASGCHLHYGIFSPLETERFGLHPDTAKRMKLPRWEIARIDPLLVLPERPGIAPSRAIKREKAPATLALPRLTAVPAGD